LVSVKKDATAILSDISAISTNSKSFTDAVNNYNGGFFDAISISNADAVLDAFACPPTLAHFS